MGHSPSSFTMSAALVDEDRMCSTAMTFCGRLPTPYKIAPEVFSLTLIFCSHSPRFDARQWVKIEVRLYPQENPTHMRMTVPLFWIALLSFVSACTGPTTLVDALEESADRTLAEDPGFPMAKLFDDYLQGKLDRARSNQYEKDCEAMPHASIFCYSVTNRNRFETRLKEIELELAPKKYQGRPIRPRFNQRNELLNWSELKDAPVAGLLKGLPKKSKAKLQAIKVAALRETECPNRASIAIAASLEDRLPNSVSFEEIGRLYEKGAQCESENFAEKELLFTRAGLMYFAADNLPLALEAFSKATELNGVFIGRALYWLYRTQTKLGNAAKATEALDKLQLKYPFSFHSLVAMTAAGRDPGELLMRKGAASTKRSKQDSAANLLLEQVETLHRLGLDGSASQVLNWAVAMSKGSVEPEVLLYMAELKKEQGDYKSKITILSDILYHNPDLISRQTMELYFPKVLFPIFEKQSSNIDPYFLLAVARRESAFDPKALSPAKARGLLQILPTTGRRLKKRPDLFDPDTNVAVGAKYIQELMKRTDGHVHFALAAYNAGPGKVQTWVRTYPTHDPILFTDLIPFRETREYVGSVLRNYYWYRRIHQADIPIPQDKILELAIAEKN
jgi:soluble lytic murein transglycosylase-like protein